MTEFCKACGIHFDLSHPHGNAELCELCYREMGEDLDAIDRLNVDYDTDSDSTGFKE